jgi:hypothetical membrane protein
MTNKLALITGMLGSLAVVLLTLIGGANFPNYSHASQFISELGADGAPNARLINFGGFLPAGIFIIAFAFFAWRSLPRSGATTFGMFGLALFALGYLVAVVFPCEPGCRPANPTLAQGIHNLFGLAGYLFAPLSLVLLGWQARRWREATHLSVLGFVGGALALLGLLFLSPDFKYVGIAQRILEGSVLLWVMACALYLGYFRGGRDGNETKNS